MEATPAMVDRDARVGAVALRAESTDGSLTVVGNVGDVIQFERVEGGTSFRG
jgi:hypothetical protein